MIIQSELLKQYPELIQGISTKEQGNMAYDRLEQKKAAENFQRFIQLLGMKTKSATICILPTAHTSIIADVTKKRARGRIILTPDRERKEIQQWSIGDLAFQNLLPDYQQGTDAAVSKSRGLYLGFSHADCAPIMLYEPKTRYFGLVHAGIIGALTNILPATVNYLRYHCAANPAEIVAYIGPCICSKCYNPTHSRHWQHLQPRLALLQKCFDLKSYIFNQLLKAGLLKQNIEVSEYCTSCSSDLLFSNHRAKGDLSEGRSITIIGKRG